MIYCKLGLDLNSYQSGAENTRTRARRRKLKFYVNDAPRLTALWDLFAKQISMSAVDSIKAFAFRLTKTYFRGVSCRSPWIRGTSDPGYLSMNPSLVFPHF